MEGRKAKKRKSVGVSVGVGEKDDNGNDDADDTNDAARGSDERRVQRVVVWRINGEHSR